MEGNLGNYRPHALFPTGLCCGHMTNSQSYTIEAPHLTPRGSRLQQLPIPPPPKLYTPEQALKFHRQVIGFSKQAVLGLA